MTLPAKKPRPKRCRVESCRTLFVPARMGQAVCSPACAIIDAPKNQDRARKAMAQVERADTKVRKEKLKSRSEFLHEAEKAVRDYRRTYELSIGSGCISCGESQESILNAQGWKVGGAFDGGHFMGKGARPELRLLPENIWLQCKSCNSGSYMHARKGYTVSQGFRSGLIDRIGLEAVEALESDHTPRKYATEDLKAIKDEYREKLKVLKRASQS